MELISNTKRSKSEMSRVETSEKALPGEAKDEG